MIGQYRFGVHMVVRYSTAGLSDNKATESTNNSFVQIFVAMMVAALLFKLLKRFEYLFVAVCMK